MPHMAAAGAAVVGGIFSAFGQASANRANRREARLNRQFQERMSNTAIERRMADLRRSGLNPILAGRHDASSPGGAQAQMGNVGAAATEGAAKGGMLAANVANLKANTAFTVAKTKVIEPGTVGGPVIGGVMRWVRDKLKGAMEFTGGYNEPAPTTGFGVGKDGPAYDKQQNGMSRLQTLSEYRSKLMLEKKRMLMNDTPITLDLLKRIKAVNLQIMMAQQDLRRK